MRLAQCPGRDDRAQTITETIGRLTAISISRRREDDDGDEPVDAMNLVPSWRAPTKETFIEA
jgi:hypothetical protein